MKILSVCLALPILPLLLSPLTHGQTVADVTKTLGAEVEKSKGGQWSALKRGKLKAPFEVKTGAGSYAELRFGAIVVRLGQNSQLVCNAKGVLGMDLKEGTVLVGGVQERKSNGDVFVMDTFSLSAQLGSTVLFEHDSRKQEAKAILLQGYMLVDDLSSGFGQGGNLKVEKKDSGRVQVPGDPFEGALKYSKIAAKDGVPSPKKAIFRQRKLQPVSPGEMVYGKPGKGLRGRVVIDVERLMETSRLAGGAVFGDLPSPILRRIKGTIAYQKNLIAQGALEEVNPIPPGQGTYFLEEGNGDRDLIEPPKDCPPPPKHKKKPRDPHKKDRPRHKPEKPDRKPEKPDRKYEKPDRKYERPDHKPEKPERKYERPDRKPERPRSKR